MIVWIAILPGDSVTAAKKAMHQFDPDPNLVHFYDPNQRAGQVIATSLKAEVSKVAWDVYLFYAANDEWEEEPPQPLDWIHQLSGSEWADPNRLYLGDNLAPKLHDIMENIFSS
jgi:hypothetical protein